MCGIYPGYVNTGVVYYLFIVDRTNYTIHIVYNLMHVLLDDNFYYVDLRLLYTTCRLYAYDTVESAIKQLN